MLVLNWMTSNMADGNQQKHLLPSFATKARIYSSRNSYRKDETHNLSEDSQFYSNPFIFVAYRKNCFAPYKCLHFEDYVTMPMVIFGAWATCCVHCSFESSRSRSREFSAMESKKNLSIRVIKTATEFEDFATKAMVEENWRPGLFCMRSHMRLCWGSEWKTRELCYTHEIR